MFKAQLRGVDDLQLDDVLESSGITYDNALDATAAADIWNGTVSEGGICHEVGEALIRKLITPGAGATIISRSQLTAYYTGYFHTVPANPSKVNTKLDSSKDRGHPFQFRIGAEQVNSGWEMGLMGLNEGDVVELVCGPEYAYGDEGDPPSIPRNATLGFEIEILKCEQVYISIHAYEAFQMAHKIINLLGSYTKTQSPKKASANLCGEVKIALEACDRVLLSTQMGNDAHGNVKVWLGRPERFVNPDDPVVQKEIQAVRAAEKNVQDKEKKMYRAMFGNK
ncbi:Peptidyl-prolyl cis-trans isomerase FKBP4 [Blyttiomyces sp. JEL0837]|nr:Peptidyl-prolyl cis-trans isomerase FKBP4 [Blyttiomyces sp. JEL0837]